MTKFRKISRVDQAIFEQLKSQTAEDDLEKGRRGTIATPQQIVGYRRRPENIFASMIKEVWEKEKQKDDSLPAKHIIKKKSSRKHKRGHRSVKSIKNRALKFNNNSRQ